MFYYVLCTYRDVIARIALAVNALHEQFCMMQEDPACSRDRVTALRQHGEYVLYIYNSQLVMYYKRLHSFDQLRPRTQCPRDCKVSRPLCIQEPTIELTFFFISTSDG